MHECPIRYCESWIMVASTLFKNSHTQAVRLPAEMRLPSDIKRVDVCTRGDERIIAPLSQSGDSFFKDGLQATDDFMAERASQDQTPRDSL